MNNKAIAIIKAVLWTLVTVAWARLGLFFLEGFVVGLLESLKLISAETADYILYNFTPLSYIELALGWVIGILVGRKKYKKYREHKIATA